MEFKISDLELKHKDPWTLFKAAQMLYQGSADGVASSTSILFKFHPTGYFPDLSYWLVVSSKGEPWIFGHRRDPGLEQSHLFIDRSFLDSDQVELLNKNWQAKCQHDAPPVKERLPNDKDTPF